LIFGVGWFGVGWVLVGFGVFRRLGLRGLGWWVGRFEEEEAGQPCVYANKYAQNTKETPKRTHAPTHQALHLARVEEPDRRAVAQDAEAVEKGLKLAVDGPLFGGEGYGWVGAGWVWSFYW
jgi:hypothetical protein